MDESNTSGIKIRIPGHSARPRRPRMKGPWNYLNEYISFHVDEEDDDDDVGSLGDLSKYDVLPDGRLVAGSKRVARAKEAPNREVVVDPKSLQFGETMVSETTTQGFKGFGGVNLDEPTTSKHAQMEKWLSQSRS
ncbi:hypothetical protein H0H93_012702 [Arthromyces matolae]|nr:hypothetical protein H0H93_012702 [Arthromyces matolae]